MNKEQIARRAHELQHAMHSMKRISFMTNDNSGLKNSEKHFLMLLAVMNNGGPVMPSEAAKRLNVTMGAVTHYINSLEDQGYITRTSSMNDKRAVNIDLSVKGKQTVTVLKNSYSEKICGIVEYLGDEDSAKFISLLAKISGYLNSANNTE